MARRKRRPRKTRRKSRLRLTSRLTLLLGSGGGTGGLFGRLFGSLDHVADAPHGLYELLRVAVVDLAAQVAYVDVDDVGEPVVVHIPDVFPDHRPAQRAALVAHHVFQDAEFLGGEVYGFGAADNLTADAVERELGHLKAFGGGLTAAQQGADAGQEFDKFEGLDQVIGGALLQAFDAILERAAGAQDQHRRTHLAVADFFQNLETVHIGQHAVQNHQVVIGGVEALQRGAAGKRRVHRVSGAFQAPAEEVGDALFVLDD